MKRKINFAAPLLSVLIFISCRSSPEDTLITDSTTTIDSSAQIAVDSGNASPGSEKIGTLPADSSGLKIVPPAEPTPDLSQIPDSSFVELITLDPTLVLDMRYATPDNFLKEKVYDCDKCVLRKEAALALVKAQAVLRKQGYRLRLFDCYRPLDVQKKMWEIMPDDRFVGNPYSNGSMHNKGAAVDLTLADSTGRELDMGTPFDFFGREAYHAYTQLSPEILSRRKLLKETMIQAGFSPITSEWWHYSYKRKSYRLANFKPDCQ